MEKVKEYLEALKSDPNAAELLKTETEPKNAEEFAAVHAAVAEKLGFDVTQEELLQYLQEQQAELTGNSDKAAEEIRELSSEELDTVAAGKDHPECEDSFKSSENCIHFDGCDIAYNKYKTYRCAHTYYGGKSMCDVFIVYQ